MGNAQQMKGWFKMPGRDGDRTLEQQMMGLDWLFDGGCNGKHVLDAGAAEGLITIECVRRGCAYSAHGVEIREDAVKTARKLAASFPEVTFEIGDMNTWRPTKQYDIVIGLAILHKLKNPSAAAVMLAQAAKEAVVFRLPPKDAPLILDQRSNFQPHDIGEAMKAVGFKLAQATNDGPFGEWVGVWTR